MGMTANPLRLKALFQRPVQYAVPDFQRPYVWNREEQWEPLWDDVQHAADRYLEELAAGDDLAQAQSRAGRHFLGAVVLKQIPNAAAEVEIREVIDGQQRLTTLQIILAAAMNVAEQFQLKEAPLLRALVLNDAIYGTTDDGRLLKIMPTSGDRSAFAQLMGEGENVKDEGHRIHEAFRYFRLRISDWLDQEDEDRSGRMSALHTALVGLLELVVIDLDASDDAFIIFETLNARGTDLLASDLIKNYLLQQADAQGTSSRTQVRRAWSQFEKDWWRKEIRQGRSNRQRLEIFLDYWLELERRNEVASHQVFPTFKQHLVERGDLEEVTGRLSHFAGVYQRLDKPAKNSPEEIFHYRWNELDIRVATPLLMWVFGWTAEEIALERRQRFLRIVESYLVRRAITRSTGKNYNLLFLEALAELSSQDPSEADDILESFLLRQTADAREWPTDQSVVEAMLELPTYRLISRARLRMILEALEDDKRGNDAENPVKRGLTIEHVLPQKWEDHWPLSPTVVDSTQAQLDRNRLLHSFGNLTLAQSSLNTRMANHSWEDKRKHLEEKSVLLMTKEILRMAQDAGAWGEEQIRARGTELARRACALWPRPTA
jgi:hypothetical protein